MTFLRYFYPILGLLAGSGFAPAERDFPVTTEGYYYPSTRVPLEFPADHGNHPGFAIEWWYITGHLETQDVEKKPLAFQITFFRYSAPPDTPEKGATGFQDATMFLGHAALMDISQEDFYHQEKLNRGGWNAEAAIGTLDIYQSGWSLVAAEYDENGDPLEFKFSGSIHSDARMDLTFRPQKPRVLFGDQGVSPKGSDPAAASYYITFPRLAVSGSVAIGPSSHSVEGQAWMDHEISSNQLEDDQEGWDWVQMQLFDGTEVMAYRLRKKDQTTAPYSFFNWIDEQGNVTTVRADQFSWIPQDPWTSQKTGATYPIGPKVIATHPKTGNRETYQIKPRVRSAEMPGDLGGISYWEGAVDILNEEGEPIGVGFLELTGYAQDLSERL